MDQRFSKKKSSIKKHTLDLQRQLLEVQSKAKVVENVIADYGKSSRSEILFLYSQWRSRLQFRDDEDLKPHLRPLWLLMTVMKGLGWILSQMNRKVSAHNSKIFNGSTIIQLMRTCREFSSANT